MLQFSKINFKRGLNEERVALLIPDLTLNQKHTPIFKATKGPLEARIYNIGESDIITDVNERLRLNYGDPRFTAPEAMILINP